MLFDTFFMKNMIIAESGINLHGSNLSDYLGAALGAQVSQFPPLL